MLIVYFVCKIKKKAPLKGLIFDIKGIQIGKMQENKYNLSFFRTFPRLINTILPITILREMAFLPHFAQNSDSLFCAKRYF